MAQLPKTFDAWAERLRDGTPIQPLLDLPFEPDGEKRELLALILGRLAGGKEISVLAGAAGTGKTTTLLIVLKILDACATTYTLAAPTHMALSRAKEATGIEEGMTVHRVTYQGATEREEIKELRRQLEQGLITEEEFEAEKAIIEAKEPEIDFNKRDKPNEDVGSILIVDETSMVGHTVGRDLMEALPPGTLVIAVGDHCQLPPVARDGEEPGMFFRLGDAPVKLETVYRQAGDSPVLGAATEIRERKVLPRKDFNNAANGDPDLLRRHGIRTQWADADGIAKMLLGQLEKYDGDAIAVVGRHKIRCPVNDAVREALGLPAREQGPAVGEKVCAMQGGGGMVNAEKGTILSCEPASWGPWDGWVVEVESERKNRDGNPRKVRGAVLANSWLEEIDRYRGALRARVRNDIEEEARLELQRGAGVAVGDALEEWRAAQVKKWGKQPADWAVGREERRLRETLAPVNWLHESVLRIDTGFAVTCHKAQGSQWAGGVFVVDFCMFMEEEEWRWHYTALTRFAQECVAAFPKGFKKPAAPRTTNSYQGRRARRW
jgi:hypothetical protein